jgi:hypothetical protein
MRNRQAVSSKIAPVMTNAEARKKFLAAVILVVVKIMYFVPSKESTG